MTITFGDAMNQAGTVPAGVGYTGTGQVGFRWTRADACAVAAAKQAQLVVLPDLTYLVGNSGDTFPPTSHDRPDPTATTAA